MAQKYKHVGKDGHITGGPVLLYPGGFQRYFLEKSWQLCLSVSDYFALDLWECGYSPTR